MDNPSYIYVTDDVSEKFETLITNQQNEIEHLQAIQEQLTAQTEIQQEQINGFTVIVNYQFATISVIVIMSVVCLLWKVFNGWFFKGV